MRRLAFIIALFGALLSVAPASAQTVNLWCWNASGSGLNQWAPCNAANPLQIAGTLSSSIAGFTPSGTYGTPISASTTSGATRVSLPTGTTVVVYNTGTVAAFCTLGTGAQTATTSMDQIPASSAMQFTVGSNNSISCLTASGTTTLNASAGTGLFAGSGGGGGGGGGGAAPADTVNSGNLTAPSQNVAVASAGYSTVGVQITGSFTGTLTFQGSVDGTTWTPTTAVQVANGTPVTSTTGPYTGQINSGGFAQVRVFSTALSVGTAAVYLRSAAGVSTVMLDNPLPTGANLIGGTSAYGSISGTPTALTARTAGTQRPLDVIFNDTSGNAATFNPNAGDNASGVAPVTSFGSPVVNHGYQFDGTNWNRSVQNDPCELQAATVTPFSISSAVNTRIGVGVAAKNIYVCHLSFKISTAGANSVGIVEGTGGTCAVSTAGVWGGATAATGFVGGAGDGMALGNGKNYVLKTATAADDLCLITSTSVQVSGVIKYVTQ